ncbi:unnamed protein product, partial [Mesorhabditis spiculigera]
MARLPPELVVLVFLLPPIAGLHFKLLAGCPSCPYCLALSSVSPLQFSHCVDLVELRMSALACFLDRDGLQILWGNHDGVVAGVGCVWHWHSLSVHTQFLKK